MELDFSKILRVLDVFAGVTGQKITLTDAKFRTIADSGGDFWEFCTEIHRSKKCLYSCIKSDITNFRRAEELQRANVYTCPFGLVSIIVPVMTENFLRGYLILCPGKGEPGVGEIVETVRKIAPELEEETLYRAMECVPGCSQSQAEKMGVAMEIFARQIGEIWIGKGVSTLAQVTKDYIDKNFQRKITLAELSINLHYSTVSLTEHFRREFGETIMEYVMRRRVELSQKQMRETDDTIHEISERCGFADAEYFSRCFKKLVGVSPAQWRKEQKE